MLIMGRDVNVTFLPRSRIVIVNEERYHAMINIIVFVLNERV